MDRPLVGEHMSKVADPDNAVEGMSGDYFASHNDLIIGKPLDLGRLFYVKLAKACARYSAVTDFEVTWNHRRSALLGSVEADGKQADIMISEGAAAARQQRISLIDRAVLSLLQKLELGKCDQ